MHQANLLGVTEFISETDCMDKRLRWNAAFQKASAAQFLTFFHNNDTFAQISRPDRSDISTRAATDDDNINLQHHLTHYHGYISLH
ncbi:hypothetical protein BMS3Bbin04_01578 [bacterium BMS3Bbin04]|nr:hypothetical protein BMS3Bbin04_01578 [bacterium BMS3Bbin04]